MSTTPSYVTTPIYYVNDRPHIGHVFTSTVADVWARLMRQAGRDVFFLTGTDEHGLKVENSAKARGIAPKALADENSAEFRRVMGLFGLTNDDFIRTTDADHERQVQSFVARLQKSGAVYLGEFEGWYDEGQEEYYTETRAKELDYLSPISRRPLVRAKEKNYYFRLSAFQSKLEALFAQQPDFVKPEARRNEVLGRLRAGLQDVPVSRTNFTWGIPMPGDPSHVIYVWIDALFNYITALGLAEPGSTRHAERARYWPAAGHLIGKEILWFHAVIWPALLMALELPLPRCVYAHSFWIREGQKMSKTLGNFLDLPAIERYIAHYGSDAWRWYIFTRGPLGATDADFVDQQFHETYSADLVNTVGNCSSRVTAMIGKYFEGVIPADAPKIAQRVIFDHDWPKICAAAVDGTVNAMERFDFSGAVDAAMGLLRRVDGFVNLTEPFKVAKDPQRRDELIAILYQCLEAVRISSLLLWPIIPQRMEDLWKAIGERAAPGEATIATRSAFGLTAPGTRIEKVALYPRLERMGS